MVMENRTGVAWGYRCGRNEGALEGTLLSLGCDAGYTNLHVCENL